MLITWCGVIPKCAPSLDANGELNDPSTLMAFTLEPPVKEIVESLARYTQTTLLPVSVSSNPLFGVPQTCAT